MIEIRHLKKSYKLSQKQLKQMQKKHKVVTAVNDLSLSIGEREIFGLLGPNGAGKTTTLRCVATLIKPTEGQIEVMGFDVLKQAEKIRENIAFLTNELKLDKHFTVDYTADFYGRLYGLSKEKLENRKKRLFDYFEISPYAHKKVGELSTGMMQKLSIVVSVIHDPKIIIFDEPTNGLDIIMARKVVQFLLDMKNEGKTVVISTHIMEVAEKLCDRLAILIDGEIKALGTCESIIKEAAVSTLEDAFFKLYLENDQRKQAHV